MSNVFHSSKPCPAAEQKQRIQEKISILVDEHVIEYQQLSTKFGPLGFELGNRREEAG